MDHATRLREIERERLEIHQRMLDEWKSRGRVVKLRSQPTPRSANVRQNAKDRFSNI